MPLDVVKTRLQTNPDAYDGLARGAKTILEAEGPSALFLGAGPTLAWDGAGQGGFHWHRLNFGGVTRARYHMECVS